MFPSSVFFWTSNNDSGMIVGMDFLIGRGEASSGTRAACPTSSDRIGPALTERGYRGRWRCFSGERKVPQNMGFCETNRLHFGVKTRAKMLRWNRMRSRRVKISIRFVWWENDIAVSSDSAPVRNAHAPSHYPSGCDLGTTWSRLVGLGFETTRGGLPQTTAAFATGVQRVACRQTPLRPTRLAPSRGARLGEE